MKQIQKDKWKHFFVGIAMGMLFEFFILFLIKDHWIIGSIVAFVLITVISYGFEVISLVIKRGHYDMLDAIAGAVGGLFGITVVLFLK